MKRNFKDALKSAYSIPEPQRKDQFLQSLPENEKKHAPFYIPLLKYGAVPVTAAAAVLVYTGFMHTNNVSEQYVEKAPDVYDVSTQNDVFEETLCDEYESENIHIDFEEASDITESTCTSAVTTVSCSGIPFVHETQAMTETSPSNEKTTVTAVISSSAAAETTSSQTTVSFTTTSETTLSAAATVTQTTTTPILTDPAPMTTAQTFQSNHYEPVYTTTDDINMEPPSDAGMDYTVYPDISFDITENIIDISEYIQFEYSPPYEDGAVPWQSDALRSDEVVCGIVENQYLTVIDAVPYVQLDVYVEYPVKFGELSNNDRISVYVPGEYMPLDIFIEEYNCDDAFKHLTEDEIAGSTAYFPWTDVMEYYSGMELLFFIRKDADSLPENTYMLSSDSIYSLYFPNEDEFIRNGDESVRFTINEFHEFMGY